jgi:hypothetical protein
MNRNVKYVKFHQGLFIMGVGNVGDTLPSPSISFTKLEMKAQPEGIYLNVAKIGSVVTEAIVPWANVVVAALGPEEKPAPTPSKGSPTTKPAA